MRNFVIVRSEKGAFWGLKGRKVSSGVEALLEILWMEVEQNVKSGRFLVKFKRILARFGRVFRSKVGSLGALSCGHLREIHESA